jgi:hypothetical protein
LILDANTVKKKQRFFTLIVTKSFLKSVYYCIASTPLSNRAKFYFILLLFLFNLDNFIITLPKLKQIIKTIMLSKIKRSICTGKNMSVTFTGWKADKKKNVLLKITNRVQRLELDSEKIIRFDVKKVYPFLSIFSGFKSKEVSLSTRGDKKLSLHSSNEAHVRIVGEYNKRLLKDLNIGVPPWSEARGLENTITIDGVFLHNLSISPACEVLTFIILNYEGMHPFLHRLIPLEFLIHVADELRPLNKTKNILLFLNSITGRSGKFSSKNIKKFTYTTDSKSKNNLSPSVVRTNSATLYPANLLIDAKNRLMNFTALDPRYHFVSHLHKYLYFGNLNDSEALTYVDDCEIVKLKDNVVYLPVNNVSNWFHLIMEGVLSLIFKLNNVNYSDILLLNKESPKQFKELLQFVGFNNFYELESNKVYQLQSIVSFEVATSIVDGFENNSDLNSFSISQNALLTANSFFQEEIKTRNLLDENTFPKKIMVLRSGGIRGLINRKEIETFGISQGFQVIIPEKNTFLQQLLFFNQASEIILEGGSSMANLIFCQKGTKVTYLCSEVTSDYKLMSTICDLLGLEINVVSGKSLNFIKNNSSSIYGIFHSNFRVNPKLILPFID